MRDFVANLAKQTNKFGIKFWITVDVETKYLFNGFPYVGKDGSRSGNVSVPTGVVMKLMMPLFKKDHNVTSDNYFTSLDLVCGWQNKAAALSVRSDRTEGEYQTI